MFTTRRKTRSSLPIPSIGWSPRRILGTKTRGCRQATPMDPPHPTAPKRRSLLRAFPSSCPCLCPATRRGCALRRRSLLDGSVSGSKDLVVEDIVAASAVSGPDARRALTLTLSEIPRIRCRPQRGTRRRRCDRRRPSAAADGTKPVVSLVGYYVKGESPVLYDDQPHRAFAHPRLLRYLLLAGQQGVLPQRAPRSFACFRRCGGQDSIRAILTSPSPFLRRARKTSSTASALRLR